MTLCQHRGHLHPRIPAECGTLNPTGSTSPVIFCYHPFLSVLCLLPCSQAIISVLPFFLSCTCGYRFNSAVGCTPATLSQNQQFFKALPGLTSGNSLPDTSLPDTSLPGGTPFRPFPAEGAHSPAPHPRLEPGTGGGVRIDILGSSTLCWKETLLLKLKSTRHVTFFNTCLISYNSSSLGQPPHPRRITSFPTLSFSPHQHHLLVIDHVASLSLLSAAPLAQSR